MPITKSNIRNRLINFKVNALEYKRIEELAAQHAGGNVSVWLRTRGMEQLDVDLGEDEPETEVLDDDDDSDQPRNNLHTNIRVRRRP